MKLQLKKGVENPPLDRYGVPCPEAFVVDTYYNNDHINEVLLVGWAVYRDKAEAELRKEPIKQGNYEWNKVARPSVYEPDILATYTAEIPELLDAEGEIIQAYVAPIELTPLIKGKLLIPKFGAYKDVLNVSNTVKGTEFGERGDMWISMHSEWKDYEKVK